MTHTNAADNLKSIKRLKRVAYTLLPANGLFGLIWPPPVILADGLISRIATLKWAVVHYHMGTKGLARISTPGNTKKGDARNGHRQII